MECKVTRLILGILQILSWVRKLLQVAIKWGLVLCLLGLSQGLQDEDYAVGQSLSIALATASWVSVLWKLSNLLYFLLTLNSGGSFPFISLPSFLPLPLYSSLTEHLCVGPSSATQSSGLGVEMNAYLLGFQSTDLTMLLVSALSRSPGWHWGMTTPTILGNLHSDSPGSKKEHFSFIPGCSLESCLLRTHTCNSMGLALALTLVTASVLNKLPYLSELLWVSFWHLI